MPRPIERLSVPATPLRPPQDDPLAREHRADAASQHVDREGLGDHLHAGAEKPAVDCGLLGVAGHEQYLQLRTQRPRGIGDLAAVQARQADVGQQQVDTGRGLQQAQAGFGASLAAASAITNSGKFAKPAWALDANVVLPSLTLNFAEMDASTGSGMFGATANASGAVKFMIDADSPTTTVNPVLDGRSANPGGLRTRERRHSDREASCASGARGKGGREV